MFGFGKRVAVESPQRIAQFTAAIATLPWDPSSYRKSLDAVFSSISALTQAEISYYYSRRLSKWCRGVMVYFEIDA